MSLSHTKTIYCFAFIVAAIALNCLGGFIGWILAIILLGVALPLFQVICQASADDTLTAVEQRRASQQGMIASETKDSGSSGIPFATLR